MKKEIDQIENIINNSGNNFHCKVLNDLKEKGWAVLISPYYNDNVSDKPREIDLIAEKAFPVNDRFNRRIGCANIKLFIECKYIAQKIVFWFHNKDRHKSEDLVVNTTPLHEDNAYTEKHHYLCNKYDKVAKLFAEEKKKKAENEIIYKALNQSLNAMVYYRGSNSTIPVPLGGRINILHTLNYPIIIVNNFNNLFGVDIDSSNTPYNINDNFQLEVNYAYIYSSKNHVNEYFIIDVVNYEKIDEFLDILQKDIEIISIFLRN